MNFRVIFWLFFGDSHRAEPSSDILIVLVLRFEHLLVILGDISLDLVYGIVIVSADESGLLLIGYGLLGIIIVVGESESLVP